ncbi:MAG: peptidase S41 [Acidobacteria bacterium]|nr:peptidase S41 [Acidobacteriota bacterium]
MGQAIRTLQDLISLFDAIFSRYGYLAQYGLVYLLRSTEGGPELLDSTNHYPNRPRVPSYQREIFSLCVRAVSASIIYMTGTSGSKNLVLVVAVVLVASLLGGLFGGRVLAGQDTLSDQYEVFATALAAIETTYVGEVDSEQLVYRATGGMLQKLDPHSNFMDPRSYAQLRERQEGRYYGLGISINVIDGNITVMNLFEGSPAFRRGIRRGDVIARISGVDATGITSDEAVKQLRGPQGSTVLVSIRRRGYDQLIDLEVERDEINIPTVLGSFMIEGDVGYVRLRDFSGTSSQELREALAKLDALGMGRLLLDLRGNPGGPLNQAIRVSNEFLPKGDLIVYTRGRIDNSDQDYHARDDGDHMDIPLVVLVNRNSASASEIVAGAVQDHDRGLIVGETTFGKALVQSIFQVSREAGLALTTARYFTPSGRMIQRPWDETFDEYVTYSLRDQQPAEHDINERKLTDSGREVFGGGGIEPDHFKAGPMEGFDPTDFGRLLAARQEFATFAEQFSAEGDARIEDQGSGRQRLARGFVVDEAMLQAFRSQLESRSVSVDEELFTMDLEFIKAMIRYQIDIALFSVEEARRNLTASDPQAQFALTLFPEAERLLRASQRGSAVAADQD